jgi:hypothetical protein
MCGVAIIDLDNALAIVEKRGHNRPRGRKNKVKTTTAASLSIMPGKHCRGYPLGSKNKKSSVATVGDFIAPDLGSTQPILPQ